MKNAFVAIISGASLSMTQLVVKKDEPD